VTGLAWRSESEFVSVGVKHIKFWTINGTNIKFIKGSMGTNNFVPLLSVVSIGDKYVTGNAQG